MGANFWPRIILPVIGATCSIVLNAHDARSTDISSMTPNRSGFLGAAYQSDKEQFVGQACVQGSSEASGIATSTFDFAQDISEQQAADKLGMTAGGRARFGAVEVSASASFLRNVVSSSYSVSAVWLSEYQFPAERLALSENKYSPIGLAVKDNFEHWAQTCGDEYVQEIVKGARLMFSIRIDFNSVEKKKEFTAKFSISGPLASANANLQQASRDFARDAKIRISAFQFGGDISKLTDIFPNTAEGRSNFVECGLGELQQCAQVVQGALKYAADVDHGFPSQLAPKAQPGPSPIVYRTAGYATAGITLENYPGLTEVIRESRKHLSATFEDQFKRLVLSDRLVELGMGKDQQELVLKQRGIVQNNLAAILGASKTCYDTPRDCPTSVSSLKIENVDDMAFQLPPLPQGSFRLLTTTKGVWPRVESVKFMMEETDTPAGKRRNSLWQAAPGEGASVVLWLDGKALRTADLYFENMLLKTLQLEPHGDSYKEKFSDCCAAIVVQTTRSNPGWIDVDLTAEREKLWTKDVPIGDGVFYVVVRDAFGREARFDLEYETWSRVVKNTPDVNGGKTAEEAVDIRNRWWADSGESLKNSGPWSNIGSIRWTGPATN